MNLLITEEKEVSLSKYQEFIINNLFKNIVIPFVKYYIEENKLWHYVGEYNNKNNSSYYYDLLDFVIESAEDTNPYIEDALDIVCCSLYDDVFTNDNDFRYLEELMSILNPKDKILTLEFDTYKVKIYYENSDSYFQSVDEPYLTPKIEVIIENGEYVNFLNFLENNICEIKLNGIYYQYLWSLQYKGKDYSARQKMLFLRKRGLVKTKNIYQIKEQENESASWIQLNEEQYKQLRNKKVELSNT